MKVKTVVNEEGNSLLVQLTLVGNRAASSGYPVMLYAQFHDPDKPSEMESFTCTVELNLQDFFNKASGIHIMSYHGSLSLKDTTQGKG